MIDEHAPAPPSGAPQWGECSGSIMANLQARNLDTQASKEGTAAHWVGAECLANFQSYLHGLPLTCGEWLGKTAPNGIVIDDKMVEGAQVWVDDVLHVCNKHGALQAMLIEHRVAMPQIHEQNWGTLDTGLPLLDKGLIYVWDYKHGHRENRAKGNLQLIDYMAGLFAELNINPAQEYDLTIIFRIVQPYSYKSMGAVDEWVVKLSDLRGYFNKLRVQCHEAFNNPTFTSGIWCRDCNARGKCATARRSTYSFIDYVNEPYEIDVMSGAELAAERDILTTGVAVAKARLKAIEDDLEYRVGKGEVGTGLALQSKPGNLEWTIPPEQVIALASQFGVDASKPGTLTPKQTEDATPLEMRPGFKQVLKTVARRAPGKAQLINADDTVGARAFKRK